MGILYKILTIFLFFIQFSHLSVKSQVLEKINLENHSTDSINQYIIQFWEKTHTKNINFKIFDIKDLSLKITNIGDISIINKKKYYVPIDSLIYALYRDSINFVSVLAHTSVEIEQILIINNNYLYLVDMRNSLQVILDSVSSIPNVLDVFKVDLIFEITRTHKNNWYLLHWKDNDMIDEFDSQGILIKKNKDYNPNEW